MITHAWTAVETKVKAAAGTTALATAVLSVLTALYGHELPVWLPPFVDTLVPTLGSFVAGWMARHTPGTVESPPR